MSLGTPDGINDEMVTPRSTDENEEEREVVLNVYDIDRVSGWWNEYTKGEDEPSRFGAFHVGVVIYGIEYCYQYYFDLWQEGVTGVVSHWPKSTDYTFRASESMGRTVLAETQVDSLIADIENEWCAADYHITRKNCVSFAEELCGRLECPTPFPAWIKGALETARSSYVLSTVLDASWATARWWMVWSTQSEEAKAIEGQSGGEPPTWDAPLRSRD
eukprot:CAMPEP_0204343670 /NCGR_PEP_ID=MMETSP0469-20131031/25066_1 /ASSEMBLY_ACC=CAM_ASM_000384 /TAXON_ID=2969 /ORGANISM="Oxyrrhis marina" /LENGTH=216 /DNA_ID=CAMNT_0051328807 /DNA_START=44 /DNA_END=694 /DNA_ORIENTATION=+